MILTKKDYTKILNHYGMKPVYSIKNKTRKNKGKRTYDLAKTKELTRKVLSEKLCQCIKKVQKASKGKLPEKAAIAICRRSIFSNRGLKHYSFSCKKGAIFYPKKGSRVYLTKMRNLKYPPKTRKNKRS
jgi:hypothetical protein